ncbi:mfs quinate transporter [Ophiostoma piceae UAMH 11346]|uniref:Mfs quinate transporter n=1 Tax=Ophiostoma piceae (strain UAMH 11346) TaxID=1262450 RepID=S3C682_OPHP1|nr:mfs quinate transporter [Ophiostoma piceae UAMH 11346]
MGFTDSNLSKYIKNIKNSPRSLISNRHLLTTSALFALSGVPLCWDQGSVSTITSLPGFKSAFGITSATNPSQVANFTSYVYIGAGTGAGLSFFLNDRIGRRWAFRLYVLIWIIGQMIAVGSHGNIHIMYAGRIVAGFGIGPLTVIGPISLSEIAPTEIRGMLTSWFSVAMLATLCTAAFTVYGCFVNMEASTLQWQVPFFAPCIFMTFVIGASFFVSESPRWLFLAGRDEEATETLVRLRGLPLEHPRVQSELNDINASILKERASYGSAKSYSLVGLKNVARETFMVRANLRRTQQALISYALAQLSGANSVTSYLVSILALIGISGGTDYSMRVAALYSMAKFFYTLIASFCFVDALGRRNSLFIGITIQMISDIYIGVFIKFHQQGHTSHAAGQAAVAAIFIHGFGYAVGLLILPYVFVSELWPNQIRSFGAALSQCFHWLFFFGVNKGVPGLLKKTHNWGAFLFFAGFCFLALVYSFLVVPETAGVEIEKLDSLFEGPWWNQYKRSKAVAVPESVIEAAETADAESSSSVRDRKD